MTEKIIKEKKFTPIERLRIWQKLLTREEGATYSDFDDFTEGFVTNEVMRSDINNIKNLVQHGNGQIEGVGRPKRFRIRHLTSDLADLYLEYNKTKPYSALLELMTHMKGIFPNQFYENLYDSFKDIEAKREYSDLIIGFDANPEVEKNLRFFSKIYSSIINKKVLNLKVTKINDDTVRDEFLFHPEFLKQYRSLWYAFGPAYSAEGENLGIYKIRLDMVKQAKAVKDKYIPSNTDYESYFAQIIGVENYADREVMHIEFLVSDRMYNRLVVNPLHISNNLLPELDCEGYKGMSIDVKMNMELMRNILMLGRDIIILSPVKLRNEIRKELQKSLKNYE